MEQPVPIVTEDDVRHIAIRDFGHDDAESVLATLSRSEGSPRVQLAILKLADRNLEVLEEVERLAAQDFRDALAAAEYPRYTRELGFSKAPQSLLKDVIESDWKQYREWLDRV